MAEASRSIRHRRSRPAVVDPLWRDLLAEAEMAALIEPMLGGFLWPTVLGRASLEEAVARRVAMRLGNDVLSADLVQETFAEAFAAAPELAAALRTDLRAILERDPACERVLEPVLYFKGFHALETHRLAHWLWRGGRRDLALLLQSRSSEIFQTDIHPAASFGEGVFLDHATGIVAGETVIVEDDVSILQGVTLGGTGSDRRARHPVIRRGTLIGADAAVLGSVEIGAFSRIAAGSVVLEDVPACATVAGVPARIVGTGGCPEPARLMDQRLEGAAYASFAYAI